MRNKIYNGINIFHGLGGNGKSYVCTHKGVFELLNKKSKRKVFSSYPIRFIRPYTLKECIVKLILRGKDEKTYYIFGKRINLKMPKPEMVSSLIWHDTYTSVPIRDALVIIDESHEKYTGSYAHELTKDDRKFFARLRHNRISVLLISQSYEDIHPFIRRRTAYIHDVTKTRKLSEVLLYPNKIREGELIAPKSFTIETYSSIKDFLKKDEHKLHKKARKTILNKEKIPFSELVGSAYNTHYFGHEGDEIQFTSWDDYLNEIDRYIPSQETIDRINKEKKREIELDTY